MPYINTEKQIKKAASCGTKNRLAAVFDISKKKFRLYVQVSDHVVDAPFDGFLFPSSVGTFRFVDFEVDAGVIPCSDNSKDGPQCFCCLTFAANNHSHIGRIYIQRDENSHFIDFPLYLDVFRVVNESLHGVLEELLVCRSYICHLSVSLNDY